MDDTPTSTDRLQRIALQRLQSLRQAGVFQIPRYRQLLPPVPPAEPLSPAEESESIPQPEMIRSSTTEETMPKNSVRMVRQSPDQGLAAIRQEVTGCRRCEALACARTQTVFGVGPSAPRLCFFGEAPGADEDRLGEPFVGRAGQLLTDIIEKGMGLKRSDVYILNVLKCRPPNNRVPTDEEIENCREYFERQFEILKPEFICCLGATATKALLGPVQGLGKMRGKWFDYRGARVMVTYHPSYLLRNPPAKKDTWEDIQMLMREMGLPSEKK